MMQTKDTFENKFGLLIFKHRTNPKLKLRRAYHWVDRALILKGNEVVKTVKFSDVDLNNWIPIHDE